jgi:hypothetical protein
MAKNTIPILTNFAPPVVFFIECPLRRSKQHEALEYPWDIYNISQINLPPFRPFLGLTILLGRRNRTENIIGTERI